MTGDLGAAFTGGTATFAGGSFTGLEQYREIVGSNFDDNITLGNATQGTDNNANNTTGFVGLYGRDGNDVLTGGTASNDLYGDNGNDTLNGLGGNDRLTGGAGADTLNGGDGRDTAFFSSRFSDYTIATDAAGVTYITDNRSSSPDGIDTLTSVEILQFSDRTFQLIANVAPVATNDTFNATSGNALIITPAELLANDTDGNADPLSVLIGAQPAHGTLVTDAQGNFVYTSDPAFSGTDTFTYRASDGLAQSGFATVTLTVAQVPVNTVDVTVSGGLAPGQIGNATVTYTHNGEATFRPRYCWCRRPAH
ncbi:hypothetical protein E6W36_15125 [Hankyongella ginsenosidimutans]|uniref:Tandem-95 repeat protein n=1 Tax=Hankyongella ginsenosidimutans TaxID=1763828 RepID=A0A4D7C5G8_9SPHN|nr:Ig-like domain-containing protein [Hankyongella ginsenosidimutans]QCI80361.1 hypothetical protein E6W36_15125 [Hankyongella ginsenosidimutans]